MKIAVVGAGVIGLTSALAIQEKFQPGEHQMTIFADKFTPETTGDGSAGLWFPYVLQDTDPKKIEKWSSGTFAWMSRFFSTGENLDAGVSRIPMFLLTSNPDGFKNTEWLNVVYGPRRLSKKDLSDLNNRNKREYTCGYQFVTYTCEPTILLPYLTKKFESKGGKLVKRKIKDFQELDKEEFDVVVNCTGLGARELAKDDLLIPVRGQVARVRAPGQFYAFLEFDDKGNYVIPNIDTVILGGTCEPNDWDTTVRPEDSKFIIEGCERMIPSLKCAKLVSEWVGLRPSRKEVRLEAEILNEGAGVKDFLVIHNYGHGGSGITLSWGCALDVVDIIKNHFDLPDTEPTKFDIRNEIIAKNLQNMKIE